MEKTMAYLLAAITGRKGQPKQLIGVSGGSRMAPTLLLTLLLLLLQVHPNTSSASSPTPTSNDQSTGDTEEVFELLPSSDSLFKPNQVEPEEMDVTDCHMRNMDLCYAGLLSSSAKPMPTTDAELEVRCDEVRLAASCLAIFNKRCHTFKVFSLMAPITQVERMGRIKLSESGGSPPAAKVDNGAAAGDKLVSKKLTVPSASQLASGNVSVEQSLASIADLQTLCDPSSAKQLPGSTKSIRQNFFRIARCINDRATTLRPCIEDLKTSIQLFFEPLRKLPLKATCCAMMRFKECSTKAVDNLCGFGSYEQLEKVLASASGSSTQLFTSTMNRMCSKQLGPGQSYCTEVLPPSGMQIAERRGRKASKLAKVLGLFSMSSAPDATLSF